MTDVVDRPASPADPHAGRREFLARAWKALGVVAAGEGAVLVAGVLAPPGDRGEPDATAIAAGTVDGFPPGSVRAFPQGKFYLVRLADGGFLAISARCTHLGCTVSFDAERGRFPCPCHGSTFDLHGDVIGPPATRALDLFPVAIEGGVVKVDTGRRLRRSAFDPEQVAYL